MSEAESETASGGAPEAAPEKEHRKRRRRKRPLHFRLAAILIPLVVVFAAGEVFVRLRYDVVDPRPYFWPGIYQSADPPVRWDLLPDYEGVYHQQLSRLPTRTNSLGMRDPQPTPERLSAPHRVLVLGDSIAFGRGVADGEPFARVIERTWGEGVCAFNAGVPGYDTRQEQAKLERLGPRIEPHLVILEWYRNDFQVPSTKDVVAATVIEGHLADSEEDYRRWKARYIDHTANPADWSALIRFARIQWKNFKMRAWKLEERSRNPWQIEPDDERLARCKQAIVRMKAWCDEHGAKLGVVLFPAREEVEQDGEPPTYPQLMARFAEEEGILFLDLTPRWREHWKRTGETLYLPRDRCHPNQTGHTQVAAWIGEVFRPLLE